MKTKLCQTLSRVSLYSNSAREKMQRCHSVGEVIIPVAPGQAECKPATSQVATVSPAYCLVHFHFFFFSTRCISETNIYIPLTTSASVFFVVFFCYTDDRSCEGPVVVETKRTNIINLYKVCFFM